MQNSFELRRNDAATPTTIIYAMFEQAQVKDDAMYQLFTNIAR